MSGWDKAKAVLPVNGGATLSSDYGVSGGGKKKRSTKKKATKKKPTKNQLKNQLKRK